MEAGAGRRVVVAAAEGLDEVVPVEGLKEMAGESAVGAELRDPRILGAGATVVPVARGDDPDPVVRLERVADDPLEGPPRGVDLDRGLDPRVVGVLDVRVAPADVRGDERVLVPERGEEVLRAVAVGLRVGGVVDEGPARPVDGPPLVPVPDVVVAAEGGVAGPLVAGEGHEAAGLIELGGELVELAPERVRYLEVVPLVAADVEERPVAGEREVVSGRVGADGLLALAVEVAPIVAVRGVGLDAEGVRLREQLPVLAEDPDAALPRIGGGDREAVHLPAELPRPERNGLGQAVDRPVGGEANGPLHPVARVAPPVLALEAQPETVPRPPEGREDRDPLHPRPRPDADGGLGFVRQRDVLVAREGIGEHAKLEARLDEGLEPEPRRAPPPVTEADDDPVALREVPVAADVERDPPRAGVAAVLAAHRERDPGRGFDRGVPGARGVVALDHRLVGLHPERDLEAPPVVDAELPAGVGEGEALPAPGLEAADGLDGRRPHEVGAVVVMRHRLETPLEIDGCAPDRKPEAGRAPCGRP